MSLIEGIGDEVTLVFGLLVILVVGLLAWFSTHTSDIPFFSVIVVELSQRARNRNRNPVAENTTAPNQNENSDITNEDPPTIENRRSLTDVVSSALDNVNDALGLDQAILEEDDGSESEEEDDDDDSNDDEIIEEQLTNTVEETATTTSDLQISQQTAVESTEAQTEQSENPSVIVSEHELRQRRVAFFDNTKTQGIPVQTALSVQEEHREVQSVTHQDTFTATESHETTETSPGSDQSETSSENQIRVRLKYLNDTQRLVLARPLDTIGYFKRTHFPEELAQQKLVRLIYNGQDLRNETSTLQSCNVVDNSVLHCLVTQNVQTQQTVNTNQDDDINIGNFMIPIFGLILGALWYLRFNYKQYFNATSTLSLAGISFLFVFAAFTALRPHNPQQGNRHLE